MNDIGANLSYNSVFPVVNVNGTPVTDKANLQIMGNYILSHAGGSNFVQAAQATLAQAVVNAAQPNITSVGNLTSLTMAGNLNIAVGNLNISGGENGFVLQTDGEGNLSWTAQTGGGGNGTPGGSNTQVQFNDAGNFGGVSGFTFDKSIGKLSVPFISGNGSNLTGVVAASINGANVIGQVNYAAVANSVAVGNVSGLGNIATINKDGNSSNILYGNGVFAAVTGGTGAIGFIGNTEYCLSGIIVENADMSHGATAALILPPNGNTATPAQLTNTYGNVVIAAGINANTLSWNFNGDGSFIAPGNADFNGNVITLGPGASEIAAGLSNPSLVISDTGDAYIQAAINNVSDNGSADWAAYGHHGNDAGGWVDMGFTSSFFNDPNYTITGPGDGYLITQAYPEGQAPAVGGGNLVLATGVEGTTKDIVFGTGGFLTENIFGRISDANNALELTRTDATIVLPRGGIIAETNIPFGGLAGNTIALTPSGGINADQQLLVYPTAGQDFNHLHLTSGNLYNTELFLGSDDLYVKLANTGNIIINSNDGVGNIAQWTFATNGSILTTDALTIDVPGGIPNNVTGITGSSGSWESNPSSDLATTGGSGTGLRVDVSQTGGYASAIAIATPGSGYSNGDTITVTSGGSSATFTISVTSNQWTFNTTGGLSVAGDISYDAIASPAPRITGFDSATFSNAVVSGNLFLKSGYIQGGVDTVVTDGINSILLALGAQMDVFGFPFSGGGVRGQLTISDVTTPSQANGTWYYQSINTYTYQLYTDSTYSTLVDATGWSAYTGGGSVAITKSVPAANIVIDSNGFLTTFDNTGNVTAPKNLIVTAQHGNLVLGDVTATSSPGLSSTTSITFTAGRGTTDQEMTFGTSGNLSVPGSITTSGSAGNITGANVISAITYQSSVVAISALPAATTAGLRAFVNNANLVAAGNFGAAVGSGGSNTVPVYSDGSVWRIG